jgi:hypothetical protein
VEEQKKARQELAQGALKDKLALLNKLVVSCYLICCKVSSLCVTLSEEGW